MSATWILISIAGLVGLAGAYEGRSLTRDTAWWSAPEPKWQSKILSAVLPASRYWGNPSPQFQPQQQPYQQHQQPYQQQQQYQPQYPQQPYQSQQYQAQPYQSQQFQAYQQQPSLSNQPSNYQQIQIPRARYLRGGPQGDVYDYNPRQPAPWSVQLGTSLVVKDDQARGVHYGDNRRYYVQSQNENRRWP
ncbi:activating signal cointegrator 1 complex subunit 2 homolog [Cloeon dipterum]|uniref:activating signal cointegrator 1 complex subunit 2 homolog n=1 Tax=Cloeon dipterum TaxID=197152 RepID=UPI00321F753F